MVRNLPKNDQEKEKSLCNTGNVSQSKEGLTRYTYRVCLPIFAAFDVIGATNSISVVKSARLYMTGHHQIKGTKWRFFWVLHAQIISAKS